MDAIKKPMTMNDIMAVIENLSRSQGFYKRLLWNIYELQDNNPEAYEELVEDWESKKFKDSLDFILYMEC